MVEHVDSMEKTEAKFNILAELSLPPDYDAVQIYQDFTEVFLGSEAGRRVLKLLFNWSGLTRMHTLLYPVCSYTLAMYEGKRTLGVKIWETLTEEPPPPGTQPDQQVTRPEPPEQPDVRSDTDVNG